MGTGEDEAFEFESVSTEVDQEATGEVCGFEVVDDLGMLTRGYGSEGFQFNNDGTEADEVGSKSTGKRGAFIINGKLELAKEGDVTVSKFDCEGFLIDAFEETRAKEGVDFHGGAEDFVGFGVGFLGVFNGGY